MHGKVSEEFIINATTDGYNLIFSINAHKKNPLENDYGISSGGYPIPLNSTTWSLISLSETIDFIGCWMQALEHNFLERCNMYSFAMNKLFQEIPVELPKPPVPRKKKKNY